MKPGSCLKEQTQHSHLLRNKQRLFGEPPPLFSGEKFPNIPVLVLFSGHFVLKVVNQLVAAATLTMDMLKFCSSPKMTLPRLWERHPIREQIISIGMRRANRIEICCVSPPSLSEASDESRTEEMSSCASKSARSRGNLDVYI